MGDNMQAEAFLDEDLSIVAATYSFGTENSAAKIKVANESLDIEFGKKKHIRWGSDDSFPEELIEAATASTILPSTLKKLARFIYGGGVILGKRGYSNGKETFTPDFTSTEAKQIWRWLRQTKIDNYLYGAALDYVWFEDFRPELAFSNDFGSIGALYRQPLKRVRWQMPDKNHDINEAYIHPIWSDFNSDYKKETTTLKVVESGYDDLDKMKALANEKTDSSFLYKVEIPNQLADDYYSKPTWYSAILSNWLEYSINIPRLKNYLLQNQMSIKYVIYVDLSYWKIQYPNWDKLSLSEKTALKKKELAAFLTSMKGTQNAGNAVILPAKRDTQGKVQKLWEVEDFSSSIGKEGKGLFNDDSAEASSQILQAIGMHPTLTGNGPGKNFGAGSGSDQRVAGNMEIMTLRYAQDTILQPLGMIRDFNGWNEEWVFRVRNTIQTTLDQGSSEKESNGVVE